MHKHHGKFMANSKLRLTNMLYNTMMVDHWSPHGGGLDRSPDNAPNRYGFRPFSGEEKTPNTSEPLVVKGGSPTDPNDYWDHMDYAVQAVKKRNMYLALLPCWASQLIYRQTLWK